MPMPNSAQARARLWLMTLASAVPPVMLDTQTGVRSVLPRKENRGSDPGFGWAASSGS